MQGRRRRSPNAWVRPRPDGWARIGGIDGWESFVFEVKVKHIDGFPRLVGLHVEARSGIELRDAVLDSNRPGIPFGELTRWGSVSTAPQWDEWFDARAEGWPPARPRGGSDEFSEAVAEAVLEARSRGESTWRAVAAAFHVQRAQAERYIEQAGHCNEGCLPDCKDHRGKLPHRSSQKGTR